MRWLLIVLIGVSCSREGELSKAVRANDVAAASRILQRESTALRMADDAGNSPLHVAAMHDHAAMTAMLLEAGAPPNRRNDTGETPLDVIGDANTDVPTMPAAADPFSGDPFAIDDPFAAVDESPWSDPVSEISKWGTCPEDGDLFSPSWGGSCEPQLCSGERPAFRTCSPNDATQWQVRPPATPDAPTAQLLRAYGGMTNNQLIINLFDRLEAGDVDFVDEMLTKNPRLISATQSEQSKADMQGFPHYGEKLLYGRKTPLMVAIDNQDLKLAELLLDRGADATAFDSKGFSMPYRAIGAGSHKIARLLIQAGAPTNMHLEAMLGDANAIHKRIIAGEDPDKTDFLSSRPLDWAIAFGHQEAIDLLMPKTDKSNMSPPAYRAEADRLRLSLADKGYPVTGTDMNAWYPTPTSENAATVALQMFEDVPHERSAFSNMESKDIDRVPLVGAEPLPFDRATPLTDETYRVTKEYLGFQKPILEGCRRIQQIPEARYPLDFETMTASTLLPHLNQYRSAARTLHLQMAVALADGDHDEAFNAGLDGLTLAKTLVHEPIVVSQWVLNSGRFITIRSLERLLSQSQLTDDQLQQLDRALLIARCKDGFLRSTVGQAFSGRSFYRDITRRHFLVMRLPISQSGFNLYKKSRGFAYDEWLQAAGMLKLISVLELPEEQRLMGQKSAIQWFEKVENPCPISLFRAMEENAGHMTNIISHKQLRGFLDVDAAHVAIAIERYRLKHNDLPKDLNALVPAYLPKIPANLLGEGTVRYTIVDDGYDVTATGYSEERPIVFSVRKSGTR